MLEAVDIGIEGDIKRVLSDTGWEISETGAIEKDFTVKRDTEEEAIVGVWLKPVHSLVSSPKIKEALKHALSNYYTDDDNTKAGESLPVSAHVHVCIIISFQIQCALQRKLVQSNCTVAVMKKLSS